VQGISQTLYEELAFDEDGQPLTSSISDAGVATADLLPKFTIKYYKSESTLPSKAKGIGEAPTIGVPIALSRALEKALGREFNETPIRPEMLLREEVAQ
jgi:carbon-monoxide dehydrogenase large subunit